MSARDFQLAFASLIASPQTCYELLTAEAPFFARFDLTEKEKLRLRAIVRQRGISACCSLYRMNRVTPVYSQLSNTCALLKDRLVPLIEEFWQYLAKPSLQFREEVLEFGNFLVNKINAGTIRLPYLKEVLQLEMTMNELSYLPEGEYRLLSFEHDIFFVLQALVEGSLDEAIVPYSTEKYMMYIKDDKVEMETAEDFCIRRTAIK
ncbi:MAG: hypothetical protein ACTHMV_16140 [Chitinophagaceae bacterium]